MTESSAETPRSLDRNTRRRLRTRSQMLRAAMGVFGKKAFADAAVAEITERADVGSGSFYNHFSSKEEIYDAVVTELVEGWDVRLQNLLQREIGDVAELTAAKLRAYIDRAIRDPEWAQFMIQNGFAMAGEFRGPWARLLADVERGVREGRYRVRDQEMATTTLLGGIFAILHGIVSRRISGETPTRGAQFLVEMLGVDPDAAARFVASPIPWVDWDDRELVEEHYVRGLDAG